MHQPEELTHYLRLIHQIWEEVLLQDTGLFDHLDYNSVQALQLLNSGQYPADASFIKISMNKSHTISNDHEYKPARKNPGAIAQHDNQHPLAYNISGRHDVAGAMQHSSSRAPRP
ncbi:MAG: hypothetical protein GOMPHAMPRED_008066 [Gomphillus americanus]|uniref:Uncharacterized protein n=1 Tax=Gomphillus americanus TaxID=1940652 RepID=A0A8H3EY23_9LECA|nr:MAG: hypothetical protein GOMPHAMPRED_008066 [Gomphillus americanus]